MNVNVKVSEPLDEVDTLDQGQPHSPCKWYLTKPELYLQSSNNKSNDMTTATP